MPAFADVLTVSIHGAPPAAYPHFAGFADETGAGAGVGANLNLPLPERITAETYRQTLSQALRRIGEFGANYLVIALGLGWPGASSVTFHWSIMSFL